MRSDLKMSNTNDLVVENNDFSIGASDGQHQRLILATNRGHWLQSPNVGAAIVQYLKGAFDGTARRDVRLQFEADGYKVKTLDYNGLTGIFKIDFQ